MSKYTMSNGKSPTQATAQEIHDHIAQAKTVAEVKPCVEEFERRLAKAKGRTHSRAGKELSQDFRDGRVAKIGKNLAQAQSALAVLGGTHTPTAPVHTFTPFVDVPMTSARRVIAKSNLKAKDKERLLALLG